MFHVGSLRTALFDYLFAKNAGGEFLLRIEDTDRKRLVEGATENIVKSLFWASIPPDEGVTLDANGNLTQVGECGPYIQSERLDIYQKAAQQLLDAGHAYYAFDTPEELDEMRKRQQLNKQPTIYDRAGMKNQYTVGDDETKRLLDAGEKYVIRLKIPEEGTTTYTDLIRGEVSFENRLIDDQVLMKTDGFPTYHLAVVVDDHMMGITHVFRGEEWVSSTPKHYILYDMFGWQAPVHAHFPLLVNEKKQKLSKRHGDVSVFDFKEKGYLPEAMINFVAFLGWNPGTEQEIFTLEELIEAFDLEKVNKAAAVFNDEKLDCYNKEWMKRLAIEDLAERAKPFFEASGLETGDWKLKDLVKIGRERATTLADIPENVRFIVDQPDYAADMLVWKKADVDDAKDKLAKISEKLTEIADTDWTEERIQEAIMPWIKENDYGNGNVLWPTRVALSGLERSPGPFEIMAVLGKEESLERIGKALSKLS